MIEINGSELNQWDVGRGVIVKGIEAEYVHLANQGDSKAVIVGLVDIDAPIPDFLLQTGKPLLVYAVRDGVTLESKMFSVKKRPRPENYVYEEDQRNFVYDMIAAAQEATEVAAQAAQKAVEIANQASQEAVGIANQAATAATQAGQSAVESAGVATQAANKANEAAEDTKKATDNANEAAGKAIRASNACMVIGKAEGESITLDNAIEQYLMGCRIFGKTMQRTTTGKNLYQTNLSHYKYNEDGTFSIIPCDRIQSGPTAHLTGVIPAGMYTLSFFAGDGILYIKRAANDYSTYIRIGETKTFDYDGVSYLSLVASDVAANVTVTYKIQLESGSASTDFEPYTGGKASPRPDYPQELVSVGDGGSITLTVSGDDSQSMTVAAPNGLPGIPVASGGNYTDANGQQWICDEIDLTRGVYVQRCEELVIDGSGYVGVGQHSNGQYYCTQEAPGIVVLEGNAPQMVLCDRYIASPWTNKNNRAYCIGRTMVLTDNRFVDKETAISILSVEKPKCMYALGSPIETSLSAEEIAAYVDLHTYKDHTTVSNDAGAYMELAYVMDAKKYIDSMISTSILEATVE